jgi:hypothetical protein
MFMAAAVAAAGSLDEVGSSMVLPVLATFAIAAT